MCSKSGTILFFNGPTPASFCLFLFFQVFYRKICKLQRDSNSDPLEKKASTLTS